MEKSRNVNNKKIIIYFDKLDKLLNDGKYLVKEKETTASYERMIDALGLLRKKKSNVFNFLAVFLMEW